MSLEKKCFLLDLNIFTTFFDFILLANNPLSISRNWEGKVYDSIRAKNKLSIPKGFMGAKTHYFVADWVAHKDFPQCNAESLENCLELFNAI